MVKASLAMLKTKKYLIQFIGFFIAFATIYFIIDSLNMSYVEMMEQYSIYLVITNITLNIIMALLSSLLIHLSTSMVVLKGREGKGSSLGFISVLFGILTYGCTPCVIAFFASIGIAFSVIALPLAGLPYKFISLLLILIGIGIIYYQLVKGKCKVNLN